MTRSLMQAADKQSMHRILQNFSRFGDKPAMVWRGRTYTYQWLCRRISELKKTIDDHGIENGAPVLIETDFSPAGVALFFALAHKNCMLIPVGPQHQSGKDRLAEIAQAEYRTAPANRQTANSQSDAGGVLVETTGRTASHRLYDILHESSHPGLVLFSSGTTGDPKGIVHDLALLAEPFAVPRKPFRAIAFLLFDHIGGINTMLYILSSGGCLITVPDRQPDTVLKAVEKHRAELLPASPTFLNMLLASESYRQYDLGSLKVISYGAEPMPQSTLHRIHELFPETRLQQTYGLSEVGILKTKSKSSDSLWLKAGGEGFETRIVDGILHIRAQTAMLGYLNAPSPFTEDGWLDTGDAVEAEGEYIRFLGREDEVINVGGEKVRPTEVEAVLEEMPELQQAVVFGEKNPLTGAIVAARVVPAATAPPEAAELRKKIRQYCEKRLPRYKVPVRIQITDAIQHTTRFKKQRQK